MTHIAMQEFFLHKHGRVDWRTMTNSKNNGEDKTEQVTLKVTETYSKFVGRGIALVEPKVMEEIGLSIGDVLDPISFWFSFLRRQKVGGL